MNTLNKKVVNYNDIPKEVIGDFSFNLTRGYFAQQCPTYLEVHLDDEDIDGPIDEWLIKNHPDLKNEESFLIRFEPIDLEQ